MKYELNNETRGLLSAALVECLGGFAAKRFSPDDRPYAENLLQQIDGESGDSLSEEDLALAVKALEFALRELGVEEFFTITGFDFDFSVHALRQLQAAMAKSKPEFEGLT